MPDKKTYHKNPEKYRKRIAEWQRNNRDKCNEKRRRWYANNKKKVRDKVLQDTYGITLDDYNQMFENQKGCCAICDKHQKNISRTLFVDHCHKSGKVRGLLCISCNYNLGWYEKCKKKVDKYLKSN